MAVGCSDNNVASYCSIGNLASDILVAESDDEPILGGIVLVLVLSCQPETSTVISLSLPPPLVLDLVSAEVCTAPLDLHIHHGCFCQASPRGTERDFNSPSARDKAAV